MTFEQIAIIILALFLFFLFLGTCHVRRLESRLRTLTHMCLNHESLLLSTSKAIVAINRAQQEVVPAFKALAEERNAYNQVLANKVNRGELQDLVTKAVKDSLAREMQ